MSVLGFYATPHLTLISRKFICTVSSISICFTDLRASENWAAKTAASEPSPPLKWDNLCLLVLWLGRISHDLCLNQLYPVFTNSIKCASARRFMKRPYQTRLSFPDSFCVLLINHGILLNNFRIQQCFDKFFLQFLLFQYS